MTLGNVILNIEKEIGTHNLIVPQPWELKLNQWRNFAQHHSTKVENEWIICQYGNNQLKLTRDELLKATIEIMRRLSVLKGAREIFIFNKRYSYYL
ncbi:hypothetical protein NIES19_46860 [Anabaena cylindrica PCC 7122]|nr:hypothetical protein NIES19_46860 [Anabaena cylindrica PCC 7122]